jgi:undecaprenyl diphosphate synthase
MAVADLNQPGTNVASAWTPDAATLPRHIAMIMDGNGRWARERGLERIEGHVRGAQTVRRVVEECCRLGIGQLTLYSFSSENWKRPKQEVDFLMALLKQYLVDERPEIMRQNIRFRVIGRRRELEPDVIREIEKTEQISAKNVGLTLALAVNYGSRAEIVDAVRAIADQVQRGLLMPDAIDESTIASSLYTAGMPDPDLLIRTAGEMRVSNYLLWQISYAELWVTPIFWPDFTSDVFHGALRDYAARERRFGGLKTAST